MNMTEKTVLLCATLLSLLVQLSYQHGYNAGDISGSGSQSFSSASSSASSFASSSSFSSSNSFGGKTGDLINEVGGPFGNGQSGANGGAQAEANAFATAGAQAGSGLFGAGADSKASAESKTFSGTRGPITHGLGIGGGIGLDNSGSIEGTDKYGSAAIKSNCGGGSCFGDNTGFGFGGLGSYSGLNNVGNKAGSSGNIASGSDAGKITGAQTGSNVFGAGSDSKASAGSSTFSGTRGPITHGLGIGGGIGLDNSGSIEGTDKYGSAAIKSNCGGGSCFGANTGFGFSGLGGYSGFNNVGNKAGSSGNIASDSDAGKIAGAQTGSNVFGAGYDSKASGGSKTFSGTSRPVTHGLGVGGGIGLDSSGNIEGTAKYGSAAIKGNCRGGSCSDDSAGFGFGGSGSYSGLSNTGSNAGSFGNIPTGSGSGSSGCSGIFGGCNNNIGHSGSYGNGKTGTTVNSDDSTVTGGGLDGCRGISGGCGGINGQYPSNVKPLTNGPGFATGSVQIVKPIGDLSGSSTPCGGSGTTCNGGILGLPQTFTTGSGSISPNYVVTPSQPGSVTTGIQGSNIGNDQLLKPNSYSPGYPGSTIGVVPPYISVTSPLTPGSGLSGSTPSILNGPGFATGSVQVIKPITGGSYYSTPQVSTDFKAPLGGILSHSSEIVPSSGIHYSGPFPGPSLSIHHSIPASSVPYKSNIAGASAGSNADSGALSGTTAYRGTHYTGAFPGPAGSIDQSKPASIGRPSIHDKPSSPSYAGAESTAGAQAGATAGSGSHYTGLFPGPTGSIDQSKPASVGKPPSPSYVGGGSTTSAQGGAAAGSGTHYTGTFPGPTGSIDESKPASVGKPAIHDKPSSPSYAGAGSTTSAQGGAAAGSGTHYTGSFPGPTGSIDQSKPASIGRPSIHDKPTSPSYGSTGSTANAQAGATAGSGTQYTGPFPGPTGSIDQSKPATVERPSIYDKPSSPSYGGAGSTANAQAGATAGSGTHYTGSFPGPAGSIDQSKPASIGKPSIHDKPLSPSYSTAGSTSGSQAGASADSGTHYTGPFPGPSGNIYQSIKAPKPATVDSGSRYTGSFPGSVGSDHKSTFTAGTISNADAASSVQGTTGFYATNLINTTPFTEKPIINIIPVSPKNDNSKLYSSSNVNVDTNVGLGSESNKQNDCTNGNCSPGKPVSGCEGSSCQTSYYEPGKLSSQIPQSGSITNCIGLSCSVPVPQKAPFGAVNIDGSASSSGTSGLDTGNFPSIPCSGSTCGSSSQNLHVSGANANLADKSESGNILQTDCSGSSCGAAATQADAGANAGFSKNEGFGAGVEFGTNAGPATKEELGTNTGFGTNVETNKKAGYGGNAGSSANAGSGTGIESGTLVGTAPGVGAGFGANAGSAANSGSYSSGTPYIGCSGLSCGGTGGNSFTGSTSVPEYDGLTKGCGGLKCNTDDFGSKTSSGASSSSFGGSFSSAKSGSSSYSNSKGGATSHSFASSGSSSGNFGFPIGTFDGTRSGAYSSSYANAHSSA